LHCSSRLFFESFDSRVVFCVSAIFPVHARLVINVHSLVRSSVKTLRTPDRNILLIKCQQLLTAETKEHLHFLKCFLVLTRTKVTVTLRNMFETLCLAN